jgi:hypothetical protein
LGRQVVVVVAVGVGPGGLIPQKAVVLMKCWRELSDMGIEEEKLIFYF